MTILSNLLFFASRDLSKTAFLSRQKQTGNHSIPFPNILELSTQPLSFAQLITSHSVKKKQSEKRIALGKRGRSTGKYALMRFSKNSLHYTVSLN